MDMSPEYATAMYQRVVEAEKIINDMIGRGDLPVMPGSDLLDLLAPIRQCFAAELPRA